MKEMKLTEAQLRSWRPRRPSPGLKEKILAAPDFSPPDLNWLWGCLAPAAACVLAMMSLSHGDDGFSRKPAMFLGTNHEICMAESGQTAQNHLATVTFDWTNHSVFRSSMGFTPTTNFSN